MVLGIMNTIIHTLMYGYYFVTVYEPKLKHSIGFKRNITRIQIVICHVFKLLLI